jgi:hypothetical protein
MQGDVLGQVPATTIISWGEERLPVVVKRTRSFATRCQRQEAKIETHLIVGDYTSDCYLTGAPHPEKEKNAKSSLCCGDTRIRGEKIIHIISLRESNDPFHQGRTCL